MSYGDSRDVISFDITTIEDGGGGGDNSGDNGGGDDNTVMLIILGVVAVIGFAVGVYLRNWLIIGTVLILALIILWMEVF